MQTHTVPIANGERLCRKLIPGRCHPAIEVKLTDSEPEGLLQTIPAMAKGGDEPSLLFTWQILPETGAPFRDPRGEDRIEQVRLCAPVFELPFPEAWMELSITTRDGTALRSSVVPMTLIPEFPDAFCMNMLGTVSEEIDHLVKPLTVVRRQLAKESLEQDAPGPLKIRFRDVVFYRFFKLAFAHTGRHLVAQTDNVEDQNREEYIREPLPAICANAACNKVSTEHQRCVGCKVG